MTEKYNLPPQSVPAYYETVSLMIKIVPNDEDATIFNQPIVYHDGQFYLFEKGYDKPVARTPDYNHIINILMDYIGEHESFRTFDCGYFKQDSYKVHKRYKYILEHCCCYDDYKKENIPMDELKNQLTKLFIGLKVLYELQKAE